MRSELRIGVFVFAGGAIGTVLRYGISASLERSGVSTLAPLLLVNVVGAFGLAWFIARRAGMPQTTSRTSAFVAVGLLGSFTTFSAFSVETIGLFEAGLWLGGSAYAVASIAAGIAAAAIAKSVAVSR